MAVRAHPREEPHWYLAIIGVDPVRQGYGVGAALLSGSLIPAILLIAALLTHAVPSLLVNAAPRNFDTRWAAGFAGPGHG